MCYTIMYDFSSCELRAYSLVSAIFACELRLRLVCSAAAGLSTARAAGGFSSGYK